MSMLPVASPPMTCTTQHQAHFRGGLLARLPRLGALLAGLFLATSLNSPALAEHDGPNRAPVITPIQADLVPPDTFYTITITDPDGDTLTSTWTLTSDTEPETCTRNFAGSGSAARWSHGDNTTCSHASPLHRGTITVVVRDGHGHEVVSTYDGGSATGVGRTQVREAPLDLAKVTTVQFDSGTYQVPEGDALAIFVTRTGSTEGEVSVRYFSFTWPLPIPGNAPAQPGRDYEPVNGSLTWAPGDVVPQSFAVDTRFDDFREAETELFMVHLFSPVGAAIGEPGSAGVFIHDFRRPPLPLPNIMITQITTPIEEFHVGFPTGVRVVAQNFGDAAGFLVFHVGVRPVEGEEAGVHAVTPEVAELPSPEEEFIGEVRFDLFPGQLGEQVLPWVPTSAGRHAIYAPGAAIYYVTPDIQD